MKEALVAWKKNEKKELITVKTELVRDKYKPKVFNRIISKHYGVVYDKRIVLPDFTSIPFGFRYFRYYITCTGYNLHRLYQVTLGYPGYRCRVIPGYTYIYLVIVSSTKK